MVSDTLAESGRCTATERTQFEDIGVIFTRKYLLEDPIYTN